MTIRWTEAARADLRAIHGFYVDRSPAGAERVVGAILKAANGLMAFPLLGRVGRIEGTRERVLVRYPCRIVYRIEGNTVVTLRVWHGGQIRSVPSKFTVESVRGSVPSLAEQRSLKEVSDIAAEEHARHVIEEID